MDVLMIFSTNKTIFFYIKKVCSYFLHFSSTFHHFVGHHLPLGPSFKTYIQFYLLTELRAGK
jgi:hypothetical protein